MRELEFVRPVESVSVADRVTGELRAAILANRLKPGQEFSLRQVGAELGVSFIPVREALRTLEAEGLMVTRRGRSATVTPLSRDELEGAFRLRRRLEPPLAETAAALHQPADLDRLELLLQPCLDASASPDQHAAAHIDFQLELLRPATSTVYERYLLQLVRATSRYARIAAEPLGTPPEQHLATGLSFVTVLDTFRSGDPDAASRAILEMLGDLEKLCRRALPRNP